MKKKREPQAHIIQLLMVLLLVSLIPGCATFPKIHSKTIPIKPEKEKLLSGAQVLESLQERPILNDFRARGKVVIKTTRWSGSGHVFIAGKYPTSFHLEVVDFFGNPKWVINATPRQVLALSLASKELYKSTTTKRLMGTLFAIPANLQEVFYLFTAQIPRKKLVDANATWVDSSRSWLFESSPEEGDTWIFYVDPKSFEIRKTIVWDRTNHKRIRISFDRFFKKDRFMVPKEMTLSVENAQVQIKYKEFITTEDINNKIFQLKVPRGIKVIDLG